MTALTRLSKTASGIIQQERSSKIISALTGNQRRSQLIEQLQEPPPKNPDCKLCEHIKAGFASDKKKFFLETEHLRNAVKKCLEVVARSGFLRDGYAEFEASLQMNVRYLTASVDEEGFEGADGGGGAGGGGGWGGGEGSAASQRKIEKLERTVAELEQELAHAQSELLGGGGGAGGRGGARKKCLEKEAQTDEVPGMPQVFLGRHGVKVIDRFSTEDPSLAVGQWPVGHPNHPNHPNHHQSEVGRSKGGKSQRSGSGDGDDEFSPMAKNLMGDLHLDGGAHGKKGKSAKLKGSGASGNASAGGMADHVFIDDENIDGGHSHEDGSPFRGPASENLTQAQRAAHMMDARAKSAGLGIQRPKSLGSKDLWGGVLGSLRQKKKDDEKAVLEQLQKELQEAVDSKRNLEKDLLKRLRDTEEELNLKAKSLKKMEAKLNIMESKFNRLEAQKPGTAKRSDGSGSKPGTAKRRLLEHGDSTYDWDDDALSDGDFGPERLRSAPVKGMTGCCINKSNLPTVSTPDAPVIAKLYVKKVQSVPHLMPSGKAATAPAKYQMPWTHKVEPYLHDVWSHPKKTFLTDPTKPLPFAATWSSEFGGPKKPSKDTLALEDAKLDRKAEKSNIEELKAFSSEFGVPKKPNKDMLALQDAKSDPKAEKSNLAEVKNQGKKNLEGINKDDPGFAANSIYFFSNAANYSHRPPLPGIGQESGGTVQKTAAGSSREPTHAANKVQTLPETFQHTLIQSKSFLSQSTQTFHIPESWHDQDASVKPESEAHEPVQQSSLGLSKTRKPKEFPEQLGPFNMAETEAFAHELEIESTEPSGMRTFALRRDANIWLASEGLTKLRDCISSWPVRGKLNPLQPLASLPEDQVENMGVPETAVSFTWSAPVPIEFLPNTDQVVMDVANSGTPEVGFVLGGGFVFCDDNGEISGVCTIAPAAPGEGMQFGSPIPWRREWTQALHNRFSRIIIQELKDKGARYYCWVRPDEPRLLECDDVPELEHGGFCYLFHEEIMPSGENEYAKDVVFPLVKVSPSNVGGKSFVFAIDVWQKYEDAVQTPYALLTKTMQDHKLHGFINEQKYNDLMDAIQQLNSGTKNIEILDAESEQLFSPWAETLGVGVDTHDRSSVRKSVYTSNTNKRSVYFAGTDEVDEEEDEEDEEDVEGPEAAKAVAFYQANLADLDFNCLRTNRNQVKTIIASGFQLKPWELMKTFRIDWIILNNWMQAMERQYEKHAYHNWRHAFDVYQFVCVEITHGLEKVLTMRPDFNALEVLSLLTAAISHDVGHPGLTSQYLIRTVHDFAVTYNDQAPLQNMHSARLFQTLQRGNFQGLQSQDFLKNLSDEQFHGFRTLTIQCVLHTDMTLHFKVVDEMHAATSSDQTAHEIDAKLALVSLMKLADISSSLRPFEGYLERLRRMEKEFFAQGDKEREHGLPISPMMDRHKDHILAHQEGFNRFVVGPLLQPIKKILPHIGGRFLALLEDNMRQMNEHRNELYAKLAAMDMDDDSDEENDEEKQDVASGKKSAEKFQTR